MGAKRPATVGKARTVAAKLWPKYQWDKPTDWEMRCLVGVLTGDVWWHTKQDYMAAIRGGKKAEIGDGMNEIRMNLLADLVGEPLRRALNVQAPLVD